MQLIPGIDNTVVFIILVLIIILIAAALLLKKSRDAQRQIPHKQPSEKPAATWVPGLRPVKTQWPVTAPVPVTPPVLAADVLENCQNLQQCLRALAAKYYLDSFTIATSDGLVFASSGGETAQVDAARFCRHNAGQDPAGMTLFGLTHQGSELTGIIRSPGGISPEKRKRIENDTKDILNRWI